MKHKKKSRKNKKGKTIIFSILGVFLLAVAVLAVVNLSVLRLVFSPGNIAISEREESIATLKRLESAGGITNLEVSDDINGVSFSSADENIRVTSEYDGARLRRVSGEINARRVHVSSIEDGKELARVMLSPYFTDAEIAAILLRHSPDIIANAVSGNINMSFDIGDNYHVTVTGSADDKVEVGIIVK